MHPVDEMIEAEAAEFEATQKLKSTVLRNSDLLARQDEKLQSILASMQALKESMETLKSKWCPTLPIVESSTPDAAQDFKVDSTATIIGEAVDMDSQSELQVEDGSPKLEDHVSLISSSASELSEKVVSNLLIIHNSLEDPAEVYFTIFANNEAAYKHVDGLYAETGFICSSDGLNDDISLCTSTICQNVYERLLLDIVSYPRLEVQDILWTLVTVVWMDKPPPFPPDKFVNAENDMKCAKWTLPKYWSLALSLILKDGLNICINLENAIMVFLASSLSVTTPAKLCFGALTVRLSNSLGLAIELKSYLIWYLNKFLSDRCYVRCDRLILWHSKKPFLVPPDIISDVILSWIVMGIGHTGITTLGVMNSICDLYILNMGSKVESAYCPWYVLMLFNGQISQLSCWCSEFKQLEIELLHYVDFGRSIFSVYAERNELNKRKMRVMVILDHNRWVHWIVCFELVNFVLWCKVQNTTQNTSVSIVYQMISLISGFINGNQGDVDGHVFCSELKKNTILQNFMAARFVNIWNLLDSGKGLSNIEVVRKQLNLACSHLIREKNDWILKTYSYDTNIAPIEDCGTVLQSSWVSKLDYNFAFLRKAHEHSFDQIKYKYVVTEDKFCTVKMEQNGAHVIANASSLILYLYAHKDCLEQNANQVSVSIINQPILVERHCVSRVMTLSHAMILHKLVGCLLSFDPGGPSFGDIVLPLLLVPNMLQGLVSLSTHLV